MGIRPPRTAHIPIATNLELPPPPAPPPRRHRPAAAAALSAVLPGAGQLWLGHRRRGLLMLAATLPGFAAAAAMWWRDPLTIVALLVRPDVLAAMLALNAAVCAFRLLSALDAYRLAPRPAPPPRHDRPVWTRHLTVTAAAALLAGLVVTPHAVAGYYDVRLYQTLTSVFQHEPAAPPATSHTAFTNTAAGAAGGDGRVTTLLLGGDAGPERVGLRTDTMIVASLDPGSGQVAMFGLPRNLKQVPLPAGVAADADCQCFPDALNELYIYGQEHPRLFPGRHPGALAVKAGAEELLDLPIDHYAMVDLEGFVDVIDAFGGVTMHVTRPVTDRLSPPVPGTAARTYNLRPGVRHLDGHEALAYARSRTGTDDYDRMERQRCILGAVADQAGAATLVTALPSLLDTAERDVTTDIPVDEVPDLLGLRAVGDPDDLVAVSFSPGNGSTTLDPDGYPVADTDHVRRTVQLALRSPAAFRAEPAAARGDTGTCG